MEDPNLRRILNICNESSPKTHYAFLPKSGFGQVADMMDALFDADLMRLGIKVIRYPQENNSYKRLPEILDIVIKAVSNKIQLL